MLGSELDHVRLVAPGTAGQPAADPELGGDVRQRPHGSSAVIRPAIRRPGLLQRPIRQR